MGTGPHRLGSILRHLDYTLVVFVGSCWRQPSSTSSPVKPVNTNIYIYLVNKWICWRIVAISFHRQVALFCARCVFCFLIDSFRVDLTCSARQLPFMRQTIHCLVEPSIGHAARFTSEQFYVHDYLLSTHIFFALAIQRLLSLFIAECFAFFLL